MKKPPQPWRVLDLFAGAGGFSLGFHWAGFNTVVAIDHDPHAVETLQANFEAHGTHALLRDLAAFTPLDLERHLISQGLSTAFDVVIGGPPCQGWSSVGRGKMRSLRNPGGRKQLDNDPRNELYKTFLRYVSHFQPSVAVMENVPGMLSHNGTNVADAVKEAMEAVGYNVTWTKVDASAYGVPQVRHRLFFVGVRKDLGITFDFPETVDDRGTRRFPLVTLRDAIGDLPGIRNGSREWVRKYSPVKALPAYAKLMRHDADPDTIFDHVCRTQNAQDVEAFGIMKQGGRYVDLPQSFKRYRDDIFKDKYKKLVWDQPSWCVTAHLSRDCYTHIHPSQARTISVREAARIQSFPDSFYLAGNMGSKFHLIGNAVPPLVAAMIARAVQQQVLATADRRLPAHAEPERELALA
jgi:DNA (cytosine-5)-methyltransferase 1